MPMPPRRPTIFASAIIVASLAIALFALSCDDSETVSLEGVPDSELAARGIELFTPNTDPAITAEQAIDIGMRDRVSGNIREPALVRLVTAAQSEINTLAWAIVFDKQDEWRFPPIGPHNPNPPPTPSPTPPNCGPPQPYVVAFVDAATADNVLEFESERGSDLTPDETCPPTPIPPTPTLPPAAGAAIKLEGVPDDALGLSVHLLDPAAEDKPALSAQEPIDIAVQRKEGAVVVETVLARFTQQGARPLDNLVSAVNLDPATVVAQEPLGDVGSNFCKADFSPEYAVVFVDALTAAVVFSAQKSLLPPSADDGDCPSGAPEHTDFPSPTQSPNFGTAAPWRLRLLPEHYHLLRIS